LLDVFAQGLEPVEFVRGVGDAAVAGKALSDLLPSRKDWTIWTDCLGELGVDLTRMNMGKTAMFTSMPVN